MKANILHCILILAMLSGSAFAYAIARVPEVYRVGVSEVPTFPSSGIIISKGSEDSTGNWTSKAY